MTVHRSHLQDLERNPRRTAMSWMAVVVVIGVCVLTLMYRSQSRAAQARAGAQAAASRTPEPVLTVTVVNPKVHQIPDLVVATGTVSARDPIQVSPAINGLLVKEILVEQGDFVQAGQPLALLDRAVLETQLVQAQARWRSGRAQMTKAARPDRPQEIERLRQAHRQSQISVKEQEANVRQAEATLRQAEETARRYSKVVTRGYVTAQENAERATTEEQSRASLAAARERLRAAQAAERQSLQNYEVARLGGRSEDVEIASASVQETSGQIQQLQVQLDQTVVRAPDSGWVLSRAVHLGDVSSTSQVMFKLARRSELEVKAEVPQNLLPKLRPNQSVEIRFSEKKSRGRIWQIAPEVSESTRLGVARVLLEPGTGIKPGMLVETRIAAGQHRATTLPPAAVLGEGGDYYVFVLQGRNVKRVPVQTGARTQETVEILGGISPHDRVVASGGSQLNDGDPVQVAP